jgi:RNA polymerase-binding transcription factor DksA
VSTPDFDQAGASARLRADLAHAIEQRAHLEREYAECLSNPDVLQEDRDSVRTLLEGARGTVEAAEHALRRAESGQYGVCQSCGKPIGEARLEALPDTTTCVHCS